MKILNMSSHAHNFRVVKETPDGRTEICVECKYKVSFKKEKNGRIDNKKYLATHQRDTAQPNGRTRKIFEKYYGKEAGYISKFKK